MDVFTIIEGSVVITRHPKGILKQGALYSRGSDVYIRLSGGFCRVMPKFGDKFLTANPDVSIVDYDAPETGVSSDGYLVFLGPTRKLKAA